MNKEELELIRSIASASSSGEMGHGRWTAIENGVPFAEAMRRETGDGKVWFT